MFDEAVDTLRKHTLQVALTGPSPCVGGHHARDGRVGAQQRTKLGCRLELRGQYGLQFRKAVSGYEYEIWDDDALGTWSAADAPLDSRTGFRTA